MMRLVLVAFLCALVAAGWIPTAAAQDEPESATEPTTSGRTSPAEEPTDEEEPLAYEDFTVKAYSLSFYGGRYSGGTFLDLPPIDNDRTFVEEGSDRVMGYDGNWLPLDPNLYDAPQKEIQPGPSFGGALGVYLSDAFHIDLTASYSQGKAVTTVRNKSAEDPENYFREQVDEDDGFSVLMGGANLVYDGNDFRIFGARPFVGIGVGGVINSFTVLDDATGLYFRGIGGLKIDLISSLSLLGQFEVTTFSFSRDELTYAKQMTYTQAFVGLSYFIDVLPADIRAAHDAAGEE
jgi:hypothetical protein